MRQILTMLLLGVSLAWQGVPPLPAAAAETAPAGAASAAAVQAWAIDPVHSAIVWTVGHNSGVGLVYGRFNSFKGLIVADADNPQASSVSVTVDAASLDTAVTKRDEHLRSPDFFNVASFPALEFVSSAVTPVAGQPDAFQVDGTLTLLGVSRPLSLVVQYRGTNTDDKGNVRAGFGAEFSILRSEFGMDYGIPGLSDEIHVMLSFECQPQPAAASAA